MLALVPSKESNTNFSSFSLIDVHQNTTLSNSFEGRRLCVIGNCCKQPQWQ